MIKVCFLSWHYQTPKIFLDTLLKMTPGRSGWWKEMQAVIDPFEADYCIIFDGYSGKFPEDRAIYFGQHPDCLKSFRRWEEKTALAKYPLDKFLNPGEWWINHDYDYLSNLKPPTKEKKLACVMTYQTHVPMYAARPKFVGELAKHLSFDLYGRPEEKFRSDSNFINHYRGPLGYNKPDGTKGEHLIGKEILSNYKYSLEIDVGPTQNYFSERFYDALLLWTMPIYWGSNNVDKFIPKEAFHYFNLENPSIFEINRIKEIVEGNSYEKSLSAIEYARHVLLNRYQIWPYIYNVVKRICPPKDNVV
jgi:hypothetical protein